MSKYDEKQKNYTVKYMKENLEEVRFRVHLGKKSEFQKAADSAGVSMTRFIISAIEEKIARDQK